MNKKLFIILCLFSLSLPMHGMLNLVAHGAAALRVGAIVVAGIAQLYEKAPLLPKIVKKTLKAQTNFSDKLRGTSFMENWDRITTSRAFSLGEFLVGGLLAYHFKDHITWENSTKAVVAVVIGNCITPQWLKSIPARIPLARRCVFGRPLFVDIRREFGRDFNEKMSEKKARVLYDYNPRDFCATDR